jgi:predicted fused transcriptional regulator/phosphomethylpyrimidine kinase
MEPCVYIIGKDALELSDKLLKIIGEINNEK